jgi:MoxR-like ATPase
MTEDNFQSRIDLTPVQQKTEAIKQQISGLVIGQDQLLDLMLIALYADGHVLLEGVPGVAKTLSAKLLARSVNSDFRRIQFTPDLMPSDIIGTSVFNVKLNEFEFKPGPLFGNLVLADEINRAPAKTQSALFEAMEERQITTDGVTRSLGSPFMVLATQNPIEQEGTYRLPEAQLDRFMFKVEVHYPKLDDEITLLQNFHAKKNQIDLTSIQPILSPEDLQHIRKLIFSVGVETNLLQFVARLVNETRHDPALFLGASPRATLAILNASKARAAMQGRDFIMPEDIRFVAPHVLKHRVILTPEKEMEGKTTTDIINGIIEKLEIPR